MKKVFVLFASIIFLGLGDSHYFAIEEGNESYRKGDYDEALKLYRRAQVGKDSEISRYNLGNTFYRKKQFDKAAKMYSGPMKSKDPVIAPNALFNYGNAEYFSGEAKLEKGDDPTAIENYKKAAAAYRMALLKEPSNAEAKHNLELALKKIKEQKQKEEEKQDKKEKDKEQKEDEEQKADSEGEQEPQQQSGKGEEQEKRKLKPEEVKRILEALAQNEEKVQKGIRKRKMGQRSLQKDW